MEREENWYRRRIKEALKIQQCQVRMNLDQGIVLRSGWKPFFMKTLFTSPSSGNDATDDITDEVIEKWREKMPINEDTLKTNTSH